MLGENCGVFTGLVFLVVGWGFFMYAQTMAYQKWDGQIHWLSFNPNLPLDVTQS